MKPLASLFWELFKISLFVIGGGYAIIAVADDVFARKGWIKEGELVERLPVMQMIPGLIATHCAVYIGRRVAGAAGAALGVTAVAVPSVVVFTFVSMSYAELPLHLPYVKSAFVGLKAALTGIIAATIVKAWRNSVNDVFSYALFLLSLAALAAKFDTVAVLAAATALGCLKVRSERRIAAEPGRRFNSSSLAALFLFLKFGLLCFGGGFVLVPMYVESFVGEAAPFLQLPDAEFRDLMALTQMTPGPIGVNGATFFGYRTAGVAGALAASALLLLPGSLIAYFAFGSLERFSSSPAVAGVMRGIRPAAQALMAVALWVFASDSVFSGNPVSITLTLAAAVIIMKKKLNIVAVIILSALFASVLKAGTDDLAVRFPDADSVTIEEIERVSYNPDGTSETEAEAWTKILTEKGRREESKLSLSYSRRYGTAEILYVGAVDAEGREREIDVSATTRESTDNSSMSANIYDPLDRRIVCTVPGLKVGETLHVKIRRKTVKSRIKDHWADISLMEWTSPILKSVYEVKAPASRPIRAKAVRNPLGNVVETSKLLEDGSTLHVFTATNSPQMFPEPDMPPAYTQVQNIRLSTASDWREISRWYWDLCLPHLERTSPEMTNKVAELKGNLSGEALVRNVFRFVSQEIRYMGLTMEDTSPGYAPHDVDVTFKNRYGVCRDKAGLLTAMLRIAGVKAFPVLINVGAKMDKDVPQPYFNHAVVAAELGGPGGKYMLMDPTNENTKDIFPAYLSDKSYLVCRPEGEGLMTSPVPPSAGNAVDVDTRGSLSRDGTLVLESSLSFLGINDTAYRGGLARRTGEEREKLFERIVAGAAAGAELLGCDISPADMRDTETPLTAKIVWKVPEALIEGDTQSDLLVPFVSKSLGCVNWLLEGSTALEERRYPLTVDTTAEVREHLELKLGEAAGKVKSLPEKTEITGGYDYSRSFAFKDGVLRADRRLAVSAMEFSADAYRTLREDIKRVEAAERRRVHFSKDDLADADIEYILDRSETSILSPPGTPAFDWVTTNEVVKRVLTYAGKKSAAELKFGYAPSWKKVSVVSATVSNVNGKVHSVTEKEINEMDAAWVAAAPRYGSAKILVVNLPSVEIGSVIRVTTVTEVKGAPAPFYARFAFDSKSPLRRKAVRVDGWRRETVNPARVTDETHQPSGRLWRDVETVGGCDWETAAEILRPAAELPDIDFDASFAGGSVREIRDWMAKYVKIAGPSLYELPVAGQLTDPAEVVKERYATRLDYVRTMAALMKNAGFDARVVFTGNSRHSPDARRLDRVVHPNMRAYSTPVCRVSVSEGGFFGVGADTATYFIGTENEYTPLEASSRESEDYFDPLAGEFGEVEVPAAYAPFTRERSRFFVRENGSVDVEVELERYGASTGGFRKRFAEMLPEERSRFHQTLLGEIAQAASATGELVTDVESYPSKLAFKCFVPDMASVEKDVLTLELPAFDCPLPALTGTVRLTPFAIGAGSDAQETVVIRFPPGYTEVEHLPAEIENPRFTRKVSSRIEDGRLTVELGAATRRTAAEIRPPEAFAEVKDARRRAVSRANRTVIVRKPR